MNGILQNARYREVDMIVGIGFLQRTSIGCAGTARIQIQCEEWAWCDARRGGR